MSLLYEGQIIRDTYEVERFLAEGSFGEVYRVKHRFLGRQAMKVFKVPGISIKEIEQMLDEAIILSRFGHPNIIRVFDANLIETSNGTYGFFTMEYVAGGSLQQFWRSYGQRLIPVETTLEIIRQVCRGVAVSHSEKPPIIHRDLKPQNILVGYDATGLRAKVSDFGLAKRVNPLTLLASARGTLCFKAPEVFQNSQCDSCKGDVWALGSMLYLLLTDRLPYGKLGDIKLPDKKHFAHPLNKPSMLNFNVDKSLDQIIFHALALKPKDRYPTANEFLEDLTKWESQHIRTFAGPDNSDFSDITKNALGAHSSFDEGEAKKMALKALKFSRQAGKLIEAADLMEEAFNKWPDLREQYDFQLKLWRRGIVM